MHFDKLTTQHDSDECSDTLMASRNSTENQVHFDSSTTVILNFLNKHQ